VPIEPSQYSTSDLLGILKSKYPDLVKLSTDPSLVCDWQNNGLNALEGTTIIAIVYKDGVVIAGDRQATAGFQVGERRIQKVFDVDEHSAIAVAGVASICLEMAKLFQVQVEFYEKIEGTFLSLEGKANYLSNMLRSNLQLAIQGLIVIPIFAGYDLNRKCGHIYKYDIAGGRYEQESYDAEGSGGKDARASLKKLYQPDMSREDALKVVVAALWDAADEDLGTAGPDLLRNIFPTIKTISLSGIEDVDESEIKNLFTDLFAQLRQ